MEPKILKPIIEGLKANMLGDPSPEEFDVDVRLISLTQRPSDNKAVKIYEVSIIEK